MQTTATLNIKAEARCHAAAAWDQRNNSRDYASVEDAIESYRANMFDTFSDAGVTLSQREYAEADREFEAEIARLASKGKSK